jgi:hypothetical protein
VAIVQAILSSPFKQSAEAPVQAKEELFVETYYRFVYLHRIQGTKPWSATNHVCKESFMSLLDHPAVYDDLLDVLAESAMQSVYWRFVSLSHSKRGLVPCWKRTAKGH